jgi:hypothetical protein
MVDAVEAYRTRHSSPRCHRAYQPDDDQLNELVSTTAEQQVLELVASPKVVCAASSALRSQPASKLAAHDHRHPGSAAIGFST